VIVDPAGSVAEAVSLLFYNFEETGDRVVSMLADPLRIPGFVGAREMHQRMVAVRFPEKSHATHRSFTSPLRNLESVP
jgi:hypothetical protein